MGEVRKYKALLLPVAGSPVEVEIDDYRSIQRVIGCDCFTSAPWLFDDEPACYVDDEGKLNGARPNRAVYIDGELVDIIFGNMLFCGFDPETGETRDITRSEVEKVKQRFMSGPEGIGSAEVAMRKLLSIIERDEAKERLRGRGKI